MNTLTRDIVTSLRRTLTRLPGATSISFHEMLHWSYLLVLAPTDAAIEASSTALGLRPPSIKTNKDHNGNPRWWRCGTSGLYSPSEPGYLQIDVTGPTFAGDPPAR